MWNIDRNNGAQKQNDFLISLKYVCAYKYMGT